MLTNEQSINSQKQLQTEAQNGPKNNIFNINIHQKKTLQSQQNHNDTKQIDNIKYKIHTSAQSNTKTKSTSSELH